ncbi:MAG: hypothetical protein M1834_000127 [Cirrosporium novae-zelandiae]|nr:MAG: hypothetical protein M1834_000127 [Cirrosporium novae-zelandiae]
MANSGSRGGPGHDRGRGASRPNCGQPSYDSSSHTSFNVKATRALTSLTSIPGRAHSYQPASDKVQARNQTPVKYPSATIVTKEKVEQKAELPNAKTSNILQISASTSNSQGKKCTSLSEGSLTATESTFPSRSSPKVPDDTERKFSQSSYGWVPPHLRRSNASSERVPNLRQSDSRSDYISPHSRKSDASSDNIPSRLRRPDAGSDWVPPHLRRPESLANPSDTNSKQRMMGKPEDKKAESEQRGKTSSGGYRVKQTDIFVSGKGVTISGEPITVRDTPDQLRPEAVRVNGIKDTFNSGPVKVHEKTKALNISCELRTSEVNPIPSNPQSPKQPKEANVHPLKALLDKAAKESHTSQIQDTIQSQNPQLPTPATSESVPSPPQPQTKQARNSKWATAAETKAPPRKIYNDWDTEGSSSVDNVSNVVVQGGYSPHEAPVIPYQPQLANWDGNWAPPPIEWDSRPNFEYNSPGFQEYLEKWILCDKDLYPSIWLNTKDAKYSSGEYSAAGILGPPGTDSVYGYRKNGQGVCLDACGKGPMVKSYEDSKSLQVVMDPPPFHEQTETDKREKMNKDNMNQNAATAAEVARSNLNVKKKKAIAAKKINREYDAHARIACLLLPVPHAPKANIYLRPYQFKDLRQITHMWNWYVKNGITPEGKTETDDYWRNRISNSQEGDMPVLVAIDRSPPKSFLRAGAGDERVVGFGLIEEYWNRNSTYHYTGELSIWVHPDMKHVGIGKCLMDKLLCSSDNYWLPRNGYMFAASGRETDYATGGRRVLSTIISHIPYFAEDTSEIEWIRKWLVDEFGFEEIGVFKEIGVTRGRWVDEIYLQRKTGYTVPVGGNWAS